MTVAKSPEPAIQGWCGFIYWWRAVEFSRVFTYLPKFEGNYSNTPAVRENPDIDIANHVAYLKTLK